MDSTWPPFEYGVDHSRVLIRRPRQRFFSTTTVVVSLTSDLPRFLISLWLVSFVCLCLPYPLKTETGLIVSGVARRFSVFFHLLVICDTLIVKTTLTVVEDCPVMTRNRLLRHLGYSSRIPDGLDTRQPTSQLRRWEYYSVYCSCHDATLRVNPFSCFFL